jgi:SAM-dependent methyltransferase
VKNIIQKIIYSNYFLSVIYHAYRTDYGSTSNPLKIYEKYKLQNDGCALDIGSGPTPRNPFNANAQYGLDLIENKNIGVEKCDLGMEKIPFDDNSFDRITAFDLIEHIPRFCIKDGKNHTPFIYLMNEIWRVLKKDGIFLSHTPAFPFGASFQDPTHNNIITEKTFPNYFSKDKYDIAKHYGIQTNFEILDQKFYGQHLITVLKK